MRLLDLLLLHWPVMPSVLRPHVPARLTIDTFEGSAWLGVVPFLMSGVRPRFALAVMRQPLQRAEVDRSRNTLLDRVGHPPPTTRPLVHFRAGARRRRVGSASRRNSSR